MVVNKGFSFDNMVGLYAIKEVPARYPKYTGETENVIMEMLHLFIQIIHMKKAQSLTNLLRLTQTIYRR